MSRQTISRHWTDKEHDLAVQIVRAVAKGGGNLVGTLSVVRGVGMPAGRDSRARSVAKVQDVMPLAVMLAPSLYPGMGLVVNRDHTYAITADADTAKRTAIVRAKQVRTKVERMAAELAPLEHSVGLASVTLRHQVGVLLNALAPDLWDALVADIEKSDAA